MQDSIRFGALWQDAADRKDALQFDCVTAFSRAHSVRPEHSKHEEAFLIDVFFSTFLMQCGLRSTGNEWLKGGGCAPNFT